MAFILEPGRMKVWQEEQLEGRGWGGYQFSSKSIIEIEKLYWSSTTTTTSQAGRESASHNIGQHRVFIVFSDGRMADSTEYTTHGIRGGFNIFRGKSLESIFLRDCFFIFEYFMLYFLSLFNFVLCPQYFFYKLPLGGWGEISLIYSPRPLALHWNLPFLRCLPIVAKKFFFVKYF